MLTLLTFLLVLISFVLVIAVPIAFAMPGVWELKTIRKSFTQAFQFWVCLVFFIAGLDGIESFL